MNWKLILLLSLFGLGMAISTVYLIPSNVEPAYWAVIFIICAYFIGKKCSGKYFLHGLFVGLVNCIWITSAHIIFFETYLASHNQEAAMLAKMPMPDSPRLMMLITGPIFGVFSGLFLGLFSFIASKITKKKQV
jgi:hypothetical protein